VPDRFFFGLLVQEGEADQEQEDEDEDEDADDLGAMMGGMKV
jgi:hypothetical protein